MAYTPTDGSNIVADFVTSGVYTPVDGSNIIAQFIEPSTLYRRALIVTSTGIREILDSEIGTGLKPLVLNAEGCIAQRTGTEGSPLVTGFLRCLLSTETLRI